LILHKTIHIIFKTHLDVGFTDYARVVVKRYHEQFIPQALTLARKLRERNGEERFVWTTGSWIIYEYLEQAHAAARKVMESAILAGDIVWHGLPFTTHTEMMDRGLFKAGLSLSADLDRRFGKKTIAAKMTDVPGHCREIIPLLAEAGIRFLHLGINPACMPVKVPALFRWEAPDKSEMVVNYVTDYGHPLDMEGFGDRLVFAHTGDNQGPSSLEDVIAQFAQWKARSGDAEVKASTLDRFAEKLLLIRKKLPVVTGEMGDTWIHGLATDARKTAQFRQLCRLRKKWEAVKPASVFEVADAFTRKLLCVPEHTWGMDRKTHLKDTDNFAKPDFARARRRNREMFERFEASWQEQRDYITQSIRCLDDRQKRKEAWSALRDIVPRKPSLKGFSSLANLTQPDLCGFEVVFAEKTGAIRKLVDRRTGKSWCRTGGHIGLFQYEVCSAKEYAQYYRRYSVNKKATASWAIPDLTKPGLEKVAFLRHRFFRPEGAAFYQRKVCGGVEILARLTMPEPSVRTYGAPAEVWIRYTFQDQSPEIGIELSWFRKDENRMPEALWFTVDADGRFPKRWTMDKMEGAVSPFEVIRGGNRALHAVCSGVFYDGPDGRFKIETQDAPLVSPGRPRILEFDQTQPNLKEGFHFCLQHNLWGTNFPQWFGDDACFRFALKMMAMPKK
jgi:hypothetical protein